MSLYPFRLSFMRGQEPSFFADEGFSVYRVVNLGGDVRLETPALNWFALVRQSVTGRREEYTNVRIADQPPELFVPPPGVAVAITNELGGIISVRTGEPEPPELKRLHDRPHPIR